MVETKFPGKDGRACLYYGIRPKSNKSGGLREKIVEEKGPLPNVLRVAAGRKVQGETLKGWGGSGGGGL